jgi:hypothetical protein
MLLTMIGTLSWRDTMSVTLVSISIAATVASDAAYTSGPRSKHSRLSGKSLAESWSPATLARERDDQRQSAPDSAAEVDGLDEVIDNPVEIPRTLAGFSARQKPSSMKRFAS